MGKRIFVGNLPYSVTEADLKALFSEIGACESASVVEDRDSGRSRGFGFVEMANDADAARAISELDGREMNGRKINVSEAHERPQRKPRRF
jgi:RNA recognition motif-containing protein